jgi:hypothetical protein
MEAIYKGEVAQARQQNLKVGEVSCLAGCPGDFRRFLPIFVQMTRLMAQYARKNGMHQFLIAVHPKHAGFYQRFMGFEKIGPVREYPSVQNAPAVACCLDFDRIDRERPKCWQDFFGTPLKSSRLKTIPMTDQEFKEYQMVADFISVEDLGRNAPRSTANEQAFLLSRAS